MTFALTGARVFDGDSIHENAAVIVEGARITHVIPEAKLGSSVERHHLNGGILAPGFIDVQVNGGGGALLNDNPAIETVQQIARAHREFGTTGLLPTVITDAPDVLASAIKAVRTADMPNVLGIHIEGPFLDRDRKGAHDEHFIREMTDADVELISETGLGVTMLTVAPNRVQPRHIKALTARHVLVSLGHSNASAGEVQAALHAGATAFTHVFNAMGPLTGRKPGMLGMALSDRDSFCGLIADGFHVHDVSMQLLLAAKRRDRIMLISDAMSSAAGGPDSFKLQGRKVRREGGRLLLEDGTLAGSNLTLDEAVRYCVTRLGVGLEDALRMASLNPAIFIGRGHELGRLAPGWLASMVHMSDDLRVLQTWVNGQ